MKKILAVATMMFFASLALPANSQSTTGGISGEAQSGDTIYVSNPDTGFKRELKISKGGKYQLRHLPAGTYQVIAMHPDGSFGPSQQLDVQQGTTSRAMTSAVSGKAETP